MPTRRIRGGDFSNQVVLAGSPPGLSGSLNMLAEAANIGFRVAAEVCLVPPDPPQLVLDVGGGDLLLRWEDPGDTDSWSIYRESTPDPAGWGVPHRSGVVDQDPFTAGVQFRDVGALSAGSPLFYRVTGVNACGESPVD